MPLSIRIISSPDGEPIALWNQTFPEEGGEIGRAFGAIMQLTDSGREVSGTHAIIRKTSAGYQIEDNSTNGLFINGSFVPLGQGNTAILSDGDVLDIGKYRLLISCFAPNEVSRPLSMQYQKKAAMNDDPFRAGSLSPLKKTADQQPIEHESITDEKTHFPVIKTEEDFVLDDPFLMDEIAQKQSQTEFVIDFDTGDQDEPFSDGGYKAILPSLVEAPSRVEKKASSSYLVAEYQRPALSLENQMDKAIDMALTRFLADISPHAIELMFDELSSTTRWPRKPKYWDIYKRYFTRQVETREWKIKFHAYLHDALRLQRNLNGGDR